MASGGVGGSLLSNGQQFFGIAVSPVGDKVRNVFSGRYDCKIIAKLIFGMCYRTVGTGGCCLAYHFCRETHLFGRTAKETTNNSTHARRLTSMLSPPWGLLGEPLVELGGEA